MPRQTYGTIAHPGSRYDNPFSPAKMEEMIDLLQLPASAVVLDLGTGKAELLIRLVERYQVSALGLELDASDLQEAREQVAARIPSGRLELRQDDARTFEPGPQTFDLACCIGACHIFGGIRPTLEHLAPWVRPGGKILVGESYWKQEPAQEYQAALATQREELQNHAGNVAAGVALGLVPIYASVCNEDEWDRFEWLNLHERYRRLPPDDPGLPTLIAELGAWRDLYLRWGRDTLGFGLYLFQA
jgi:cyclopropane fatty-acyl-phospholipid synthase-like methyltransferase